MRWGSVAVLAVVRPARLQVRPVTREVSHPVSPRDASGARDLSGEKGFRRAVRHCGSFPFLPHQEGHTWCSRTLKVVKEGMEARMEYALEPNRFLGLACPDLSDGLIRLSFGCVVVRRPTDRQRGGRAALPVHLVSPRPTVPLP